MSRARILADYVSSGDELADKLDLSGGAMTGAITTNSTFDGVDVATRDAILTSTTTLATDAAPKASPVFTGIATAPSLVLTPGSAPATTEGAMYYNSNTNIVTLYNGAEWEQINNNAIGGIITSYVDSGNTYRVHTFLTSGIFDLLATVSADVFMIGGGGGGGGGNGGGGGAGGVLYRTGYTLAIGEYPIVIGGGGQGSHGSNANTLAFNGSDTTAFTVLALGCGAGGGGVNGTVSESKGANGGSGGGTTHGADGGGGSVQEAFSGWTSYGYNGGNGHVSDSEAGGAGGGGASAVGYNSGTDANARDGGDGGAGRTNDYRTGSNITYGGGGGGGCQLGSHPLATPGAGGTGGGGAGAPSPTTAATAGTANTGSGGGGGEWNGTMSALGTAGAPGGSGIVIIRYQI